MIMVKIEVFDDCLAPARFIFLDYKGKAPFDVYQKVSGMLQGFFEVSSSGTGETDFRWDNAGPNDEFYARWWVQKKMAKSTTMWVHIMVQGEKNRETNEGHFSMRLHAENRTSMTSSNPFFRALWWTYMYLFYNSRRRDYLKQCNDLLYEFRDTLKEHYNLQQIRGE
jgi:hypothetical protein